MGTVDKIMQGIRFFVHGKGKKLSQYALFFIILNTIAIDGVAQSFTFPITVSDGSHQTKLTIGMVKGATDGYDPGLDTLAPPPPPGGAFDARLTENGQDYFVDYRDTTLQTKTYVIEYAAATGEGPITLKWDPNQLKTGWAFTITDDFDGKSYQLDMQSTDSLNVSTSAYLKDGLRIVVSPVVSQSKIMLSLPITVGDGSHQQVLTLGMAVGATDDFDPGLDTLAPPPPPSGAFDARLSKNGQDYFVDYRDTTHQTKTYVMKYDAATTDGPITLKWDGSKLQVGWSFGITDNIDGTNYHLDMRNTDSLNISSSNYLKDGLRINVGPSLILSEDNLNFGQIEVGKFLQKKLTIENKSKSVISIDKITNNYPVFEDSLSSDTLKPNSKINIIITFKPIRNINYSDTLTVRTNLGYSVEATLSGQGLPTPLEKPMNGSPSKFTLEQNYPNPFNPTTIIHYGFPSAQHVTVQVYNTLGQLITTLVDKMQSAGSYSVSFDAHNLPSGMYIYRLKAGNYIQTKKMMLIK